MKNKGDWLLLFAAFIGGGGFVSLKYLLNYGYSPYQVIFMRFFVASLCMCAVLRKRLKKITKKEWQAGGILGISLAVMFLLMTIGLQHTTPSVNAFLVNTPAVIVPLLCWGIFRKKPSQKQVFAAVLTGIGVCCLSLDTVFQIDIGAVLSLLAAVSFSFQMTFLGHIAEDCDAVHLAVAEHIATFVVMLFVVIVTGWDMPVLTIPVVVNFCFLGVFCTAVYLALQAVGQRTTPPEKAAIILTAESIFAALFSAFFYHERMKLRGYLGCGMIFIAMIWAEQKKVVDKANKIK